MIMEKINEQKSIDLVNIDDTIYNFNSITIDTAKVISDKYRARKKSRITDEFLEKCDPRRSLQNNKHESGAKYKLTNTIKREMKNVNENWIKQKFSDI